MPIRRPWDLVEAPAGLPGTGPSVPVHEPELSSGRGRIHSHVHSPDSDLHGHRSHPLPMVARPQVGTWSSTRRRRSAARHREAHDGVEESSGGSSSMPRPFVRGVWSTARTIERRGARLHAAVALERRPLPSGERRWAHFCPLSAACRAPARPFTRAASPISPTAPHSRPTRRP